MVPGGKKKDYQQASYHDGSGYDQPSGYYDYYYGGYEEQHQPYLDGQTGYNYYSPQKDDYYYDYAYSNKSAPTKKFRKQGSYSDKVYQDENFNTNKLGFKYQSGKKQ